MAKQGRKRKFTRREPNGRCDRADKTDMRIVVFNQPHRRQFGPDQRCESLLGTLNLWKLISDAELQAATLYARIVQRMARVLDSPNPNPRTLALDAIPGRSLHELEDESVERIRNDYSGAYCYLLGAGRNACRAVNRLAVYNEQLPSGTDIVDLKNGLGALVRYFRL